MKNFKRILDLIRKTGDRYLFEDEQGNIFVTLELNDYENLVLKNSSLANLSEEELLNKINKDIAVWKSSQEENSPDLPELDEERAENEEDRYYFEPVEEED
jgi:hypothetical protein